MNTAPLFGRQSVGRASIDRAARLFDPVREARWSTWSGAMRRHGTTLMRSIMDISSPRKARSASSTAPDILPAHPRATPRGLGIGYIPISLSGASASPSGENILLPLWVAKHLDRSSRLGDFVYQGDVELSRTAPPQEALLLAAASKKLFALRPRALIGTRACCFDERSPFEASRGAFRIDLSKCWLR